MNKQGPGKIGWTDFTWNVGTGCLKRCKFCFAMKLANGRLKPLYLSNKAVLPGCDLNDPFAPRFWYSRLFEPQALKKPSKIFVADMGEIFHLTADWFFHVLEIMKKCPQHTFQLLTKAPEYIDRFLWNYGIENLPDNVWLGVSITHNERRDIILRNTQSCRKNLKFVSFEPLLGDVTAVIDLDFFDWIIVGCQTNPRIEPNEKYMENIITRASALKIPLFLKENLHWDVKIQQFPEWRNFD